MPKTSRTQSARRYDPARRERIIEAALRVVEQDGLSALTFRSVADAADVPLGSTTYHFEDKDALVKAVTRTMRERNVDFATEALRRFVAEHGVVRGIALLVEEITVRRHQLLVLEHDLYLAALRNPSLREESRKWSAGFADILAEYTDRVTANALGFLFDGICMQAAVLDIMYFASDVEEEIRRVVAGGECVNSHH